MHIADMSKGMLGTNGIVAGSVPLAVGAALTSKLKYNNQRVAVAFFGDGGANQGVLHECMNLASVWKLPVIFCCENNGYAESHAGGVRLLRRAHFRPRPPGTICPASPWTA